MATPPDSEIPDVADLPKAYRVGAITGLWSYFETLDWEEPWLWGLMAFHVLCVVFTIGALLSRSFNIQAVFFFLYLMLAYSAQYINEWAAANYKLFSAQQYFDSQGMFISLLFSTPLILNSFVIVVVWVWDTGSTLINLQRQKLKVKARQQQKQKEANESKPEDQTEAESQNSGDEKPGDQSKEHATEEQSEEQPEKPETKKDK